MHTVVISHPDTDHYSALLDCAEPLGVRTVIVAESFRREAGEHTDGPAAYVLAELERMGIDVRTARAADALRLADLDVRFIHPLPGFEAESDNDSSLVALIETPTSAGPKRLLLCSDVEEDAMDSIRARMPDLRVDVMNAPHHGSARDFAYDFVAALDPAIIVQSTGPSRLGDERWDDVKQGRRWLITAADGAASVVITDDGEMTAKTFRHP